MTTEPKSPQFNLNDNVLTLCCKDAIGCVVGRAEYTNSSNNYLIRYKCADGRAIEAWWSEDALTLCEA